MDERRAHRAGNARGRGMTCGTPDHAPVRTVLVPGTDARWRGLRGYVAECHCVSNLIRCCRRHYSRCARVYRSLDVERDVRASFDLDGLDVLAAFLAEAGRRGARLPHGRPFSAEFTRAELGILRMAATNHIRSIRSGRAAEPRPKGPRLDPARLPDAALGHLIQIHSDLALVNRLRSERARRRSGADR